MPPPSGLDINLDFGLQMVIILKENLVWLLLNLHLTTYKHSFNTLFFHVKES